MSLTDPERPFGCNPASPTVLPPIGTTSARYKMPIVAGNAAFGQAARVLCPSSLRHNRLLWTRATQSRLRYFPHSSNARRKRISWPSESPHLAPSSPASKRTYRLCTNQRRSGGYQSRLGHPNLSISDNCGAALTMRPSRIMSTATRPSMTLHRRHTDREATSRRNRRHPAPLSPSGFYPGTSRTCPTASSCVSVRLRCRRPLGFWQTQEL